MGTAVGKLLGRQPESLSTDILLIFGHKDGLTHRHTNWD